MTTPRCVWPRRTVVIYKLPSASRARATSAPPLEAREGYMGGVVPVGALTLPVSSPSTRPGRRQPTNTHFTTAFMWACVPAERRRVGSATRHTAQTMAQTCRVCVDAVACTAWRTDTAERSVSLADGEGGGG